MSNKRFINQRFRWKYSDLLSFGRGNETSTNIVWYMHSFRALFVLYEAELDNKNEYLEQSSVTVLWYIVATHNSYTYGGIYLASLN